MTMSFLSRSKGRSGHYPDAAGKKMTESSLGEI
ncbi:hypothetical protein J2T17_005168 [Paenibacillus mucilaginosus]